MGQIDRASRIDWAIRKGKALLQIYDKLSVSCGSIEDPTTICFKLPMKREIGPLGLAVADTADLLTEVSEIAVKVTVL
jgi:hypothetical protein